MLTYGPNIRENLLFGFPGIYLLILASGFVGNQYPKKTRFIRYLLTIKCHRSQFLNSGGHS